MVLNLSTDNPVSDNDGTLSSCGNNQWCCGPDVTSGNCSCQSGEGTFKVSDGHAFAIIGEDGAQDGAPQETNTDTVPTATSVSAQAKSSASSSTKSTSSTSTSSASSSATPPPKKDINTAVVAGTSTAVGVAALLIIALLIVLFRVRRHKKRRDSRTNTTVTGMSTPARVRTVAQPTRPPSPNPYDNVTHATMPPNQDGIAQANRSQFNGFIIPDGDTEDRRQGEMRGPPAVDPYDVPEVPDHLFGNRERYGIGVGAGGGFGDGVESRAPPPPSYRTNAASPPPQRRNVLRRQRSRISEGSRLSTA
ncbi:uncharacterized protein KY384_007928 [Bacidia gigantensis]|uniref:uncharacterized protein n=1 Tax=Bacidia gigantensis TaxID=2732470 RepID=UPI001D037F1A|nr:uncharacterized protein KY384_007928 [Bacidia gigantensis]KAG8527774.1 hypothetical protein KY384_007928 [Bacidia gigantensis]